MAETANNMRAKLIAAIKEQTRQWLKQSVIESDIIHRITKLNTQHQQFTEHTQLAFSQKICVKLNKLSALSKKKPLNKEELTVQIKALKTLLQQQDKSIISKLQEGTNNQEGAISLFAVIEDRVKIKTFVEKLELLFTNLNVNRLEKPNLLTQLEAQMQSNKLEGSAAGSKVFDDMKAFIKHPGAAWLAFYKQYARQIDSLPLTLEDRTYHAHRNLMPILIDVFYDASGSLHPAFPQMYIHLSQSFFSHQYKNYLIRIGNGFKNVFQERPEENNRWLFLSFMTLSDQFMTIKHDHEQKQLDDGTRKEKTDLINGHIGHERAYYQALKFPKKITLETMLDFIRESKASENNIFHFFSLVFEQTISIQNNIDKLLDEYGRPLLIKEHKTYDEYRKSLNSLFSIIKALFQYKLSLTKSRSPYYSDAVTRIFKSSKELDYRNSNYTTDHLRSIYINLDWLNFCITISSIDIYGFLSTLVEQTQPVAALFQKINTFPAELQPKRNECYLVALRFLVAELEKYTAHPDLSISYMFIRNIKEQVLSFCASTQKNRYLFRDTYQQYANTLITAIINIKKQEHLNHENTLKIAHREVYLLYIQQRKIVAAGNTITFNLQILRLRLKHLLIIIAHSQNIPTSLILSFIQNITNDNYTNNDLIKILGSAVGQLKLDGEDIIQYEFIQLLNRLIEQATQDQSKNTDLQLSTLVQKVITAIDEERYTFITLLTLICDEVMIEYHINRKNKKNKNITFNQSIIKCLDNITDKIAELPFCIENDLKQLSTLVAPLVEIELHQLSPYFLAIAETVDSSVKEVLNNSTSVNRDDYIEYFNDILCENNKSDLKYINLFFQQASDVLSTQQLELPILRLCKMQYQLLRITSQLPALFSALVPMITRLMTEFDNEDTRALYQSSTHCQVVEDKETELQLNTDTIVYYTLRSILKQKDNDIEDLRINTTMNQCIQCYVRLAISQNKFLEIKTHMQEIYTTIKSMNDREAESTFKPILTDVYQQLYTKAQTTPKIQQIENESHSEIKIEQVLTLCDFLQTDNRGQNIINQKELPSFKRFIKRRSSLFDTETRSESEKMDRRHSDPTLKMFHKKRL